jgi:hypothetical protein
MGCDDASKAALRALSGMTNATSTFPAARFRPAPRFDFDTSARPRQPPPGGGLGAAPPLPSRRLDRRASRDRVIDRAIARRTGTPRRRSCRAPLARSEPRHRHSCGVFATFRVAEGTVKFAFRPGFGARCTYRIFSSPPNSLRRFPFLAPRSRQHLRRRRGIPHRENRFIVH